MMRMQSLLAVLFACALLVACASPVRNEVTSFHDATLPRGATVRVVALDRHKENSLEFKHYAQLVRDELQRAGYQPVDRDAEATLQAELDWWVSDGETVIRTRPGTTMRPHYGFGGWYDPFWYGRYNPWYDPFYHGLNDRGPETYSFTEYQRDLRLTIVDAHARGKPVFEGRVHSVGREQDIAEVMPQMVSALFRDYPGESGVTRKVTVSRER
jgi:hypothetical protein